MLNFRLRQRADAFQCGVAAFASGDYYEFQ